MSSDLHAEVNKEAILSRQEDTDEIFSLARTLRWYLFLIGSVSGGLLLTGLLDISGNITAFASIWLLRVLAFSVLFLGIVPDGSYGVELEFGLRRTPRIITKSGPHFRWPWMQIMLVSQRPIESTGVFNYRSAYGSEIEIRYRVLFRASPDIKDTEGRNVFLEYSLNDPSLTRLKDEIRLFLEYRFGWACRPASAKDLLQGTDALEIMACCMLKLRTPPHENPLFVGDVRLPDQELLQFYRQKTKVILELYPKYRLRPILHTSIVSGRYCGMPQDSDGAAINPQFLEEISEPERRLGIEFLNCKVNIAFEQPH